MVIGGGTAAHKMTMICGEQSGEDELYPPIAGDGRAHVNKLALHASPHRIGHDSNSISTMLGWC